VFDSSQIITVLIPLVAVIVWLVRMEGRINSTEQSQKTMAMDLLYVRNRIDRALNGRSAIRRDDDE
jgi:hypothetical protein